MLTPEEQAAVDAERDAIRAAMPDISEIFEHELEQRHTQSRRRDAERIASGEATADEIQRENDPFTPEQYRRMIIENFEEMLLSMK